MAILARSSFVRNLGCDGVIKSQTQTGECHRLTFDAASFSALCFSRSDSMDSGVDFALIVGATDVTRWVC